jgi:spore germination protein GerM
MNKYDFILSILLCCLYGCSSTQNHIGLRAGSQFSSNSACSAVWIPYGLRDSIDDFVLVSKCVSYSEDQNIFMKNALERLLLGPDKEDSRRGFTSLVKSGRLLDVRIKHGIASVTFSKEFAPTGGSTAVWHARTAVHELLKQFPNIKRVKIIIDGVPEEETLQP